MEWSDFFTHPILRGPTFGSLFMSIASSLMGVIVLLKKRVQLIETLSHASYPGAILSLTLFAFFFPGWQMWAGPLVLLGAFFSSWLGAKVVDHLEKKRVYSDSALSFVLALFFGMGILLASALQTRFPQGYQSVQKLLFGQVATITDFQAGIYGILALKIILFLMLSFRGVQALLFDANYARLLGVNIRFFEKVIFGMLLFSLVLGMKSVGVVLMTGMTVAPATAARQFSDRLHILFILSAFFGAASAFLGVALSLYFPKIPTGPLIVLIATSWALFSCMFAPKRGFLFRLIRGFRFQLLCLKENVLKGLWKEGALSFQDIQKGHSIKRLTLFYVLFSLRKEGWLEKREGRYTLNQDGVDKALSIIRLHRLWELYLTETFGMAEEDVHVKAEEMEHVLTADLEERLTTFLSDPKLDPHAQPIPKNRRRL